jgi:hypothetical protein
LQITTALAVGQRIKAAEQTAPIVLAAASAAQVVPSIEDSIATLDWRKHTKGGKPCGTFWAIVTDSPAVIPYMISSYK